MKNLNGTAQAAERQQKRTHQKKKRCHLPPADGQPGITLAGARLPQLVNIGCEAAERYLGEATPLPEFWAQLRGIAPPQHLGDIEAGFLGRLEQHLHANQDGEHLRPDEMRGALAVGNSAMKALHEVAVSLSRLAEVGAVVPNNGDGAAQLRKLASLAASITWIAPVEAGAFR